MKQKSPDQITEELLYIAKTVNDTVARPKDVLAQLGIIIFPHAVALCPQTLCKLLSITKSSMSTKLQKADWSVDVMFPTEVKHELRNLVGNEIKKWSLRSIPLDSKFWSYVVANPSVVATNRVINSLVQSYHPADAYPSCPSSPRHSVAHNDIFNLVEAIPV